MVTSTPSAPSVESAPRATVYFDGACPVCTREIAVYKSCVGAEHIQWIDASDGQNDYVGKDLSRAQALARFHVRRADGTLLSGGAAFAELWASLPRLRWIGRLFQLPILRGLISIGYEVFLRVRPAVQRFFSRRP